MQCYYFILVFINIFALGALQSVQWPTGCTTNCLLKAVWTKVGDAFDFKISTTKTASKWIGIGFNKQAAQMGNSYVVVCFKATNKVENYKTNGRSSADPISNNLQAGIKNPVISVNGSVLTCTFKRTIAQPSGATVYALDDSNGFYILMAIGDQDTMTQHTDKEVTNNKMILQSGLTVTSGQASTTTSSTANTASSSLASVTCGKSHTCFNNGGNLESAFKANPTKKTIDFILSIKDSNANWIAIGFNKKKAKMSPATIIMCIHSTNKVKNMITKGQRTLTDSADISTGISNAIVSKNNGVLTCQFTRAYTTNVSTLFSFVDKAYPILASGPGNIVEHTTKVAGNGLIDFTKLTTISVDKSASTYLKLHACFMIVAWILLASMGLLMARYFKPLWPDLKVCNVNIWFVFHRTCMILAWILMLVAFVLIWIRAAGFSVESNNFTQIHPIFGHIVVILGFFNPIMALFRCHPGEHNRYLFNWLHWVFGTTAHILAIFTVGIGFTFDDVQALHQCSASSTATSCDWITPLFACWVVFHLMVEFTLEKKDFILSKLNFNKQNDMEMQPSNNVVTIGPVLDSTGTTFKSTVFLVHFVVTLSVVVALVIQISIKL